MFAPQIYAYAQSQDNACPALQDCSHRPIGL